MSNFDPDPPSRDPLDRLWVTREETIARGLVGGGGAIFVILVVIGLIYLFIAAVFSFVAAIAGVIALRFVSGPLKLEAEYNVGGLLGEPACRAPCMQASSWMPTAGRSTC